MEIDDNQQGSPLDVNENLQLHEKQGIDSIPRRKKRQRKTKSFGPDFEVYFVEGTRNNIFSSVPYLLNVIGDTLTFGDAMASHDSAFRKDNIVDEMQSISGK